MILTKKHIGRKVKVISDTTNHNIPIGTVKTLKVVNHNGNGTYLVYEDARVYGANDLQLLRVSKEDIQEELDALQDREATLLSKLAFLEKTKTDKLDEDEFLMYCCLQEIENDKGLTNLQRAKKLVKMFYNEDC